MTTVQRRPLFDNINTIFYIIIITGKQAFFCSVDFILRRKFPMSYLCSEMFLKQAYQILHTHWTQSVPGPCHTTKGPFATEEPPPKLKDNYIKELLCSTFQ